MPFHRRLSTPVKTDKHEQTFTQLAQDSSTTQNINIYTGVDVGAKVGATDCAVGSHVRWVYCEVNFSAETLTVPKTVHWTVRIVVPGQVASTPTQFYANDRSFVLKRGMEMLPKDTGTVYKRIFVVKIPRIYQRVKQGQVLEFEYVSSSANTMNACGIFIFKEIY